MHNAVFPMKPSPGIIVLFVSAFAAHTAVGNIDTSTYAAIHPVTPDGPADTNTQDPAQDATMPELKSRATPVYPPEARRQRIEGTVYTQILVDGTGMVIDAKVIKSDAEILNQAALDAARKFRFAPALKNKVPVETWVVVPFRFKLEEKASVDVHAPANDPYGLLGMVTSLLAGTGDPPSLSAIDPEAALVLGGRRLNLREQLAAGGALRATGAGAKVVFSQLIMDNPQNGALVFLISEGASRYHHSVFLFREGDRSWKIRHWHVSN